MLIIKSALCSCTLPLFYPERCTVIDLLHAVLRAENGAHQADKLPLKFRLCIACYRGSDKKYFGALILGSKYYQNEERSKTNGISTGIQPKKRKPMIPKLSTIQFRLALKDKAINR